MLWNGRQVYRLNEVKKIAKCHGSTVARWVHTGKLDFQIVRGRKYYDAGEVIALMKGHKQYRKRLAVGYEAQFTPTQAADILGVQRYTVRRYWQRLHPEIVGNKWLKFKRQDIEELSEYMDRQPNWAAEGFLGTKEVKKFLGCNWTQLRRWRLEDKILVPALTTRGGVTRYTRQQLTDFAMKYAELVPNCHLVSQPKQLEPKNIAAIRAAPPRQVVKQPYEDRFFFSVAATILGVEMDKFLEWTRAKQIYAKRITRSQIEEIAKEQNVTPQWPPDEEIFLMVEAAVNFLQCGRGQFVQWKKQKLIMDDKRTKRQKRLYSKAQLIAFKETQAYMNSQRGVEQQCESTPNMVSTENQEEDW